MFTLFILIVFMTSIIIVNGAFTINEATQKWESATNIMGPIDGNPKTLQQAISEGLLTSTRSTSSNLVKLDTHSLNY